jgi:hypothetical protein
MAQVEDAPPVDGTTYPVTLGASFLEPQGAETYHLLRYISFKPASLSEDQPGALQYEQHATGKLLAEFRNRSRTSEVVRMQGKYTCLKETECVLVFDGSSFRLERLAGAGNQLQLRSSFPASASPAAASHKADQTSSPPPSSSSSPPAAPAADAAVSTVALKRPRSSVAGKTPASSSSSSSSSSSLLSNGISAKRPRTSYDDGSEEEEEEDEEEEEEVGQDIQNLATQLELDLDEAPAPSLETSAPADGRGIGMQQPPNSLFSEDEDEAREGPPTLTSSVSAHLPPDVSESEALAAAIAGKSLPASNGGRPPSESSDSESYSDSGSSESDSESDSGSSGSDSDSGSDLG